MSTFWISRGHSLTTLLVALGLSALGCGDDIATDSTKSPSKRDAGSAPAKSADQTPPQGAAAIEKWLKAGAYKDWSCELEVHPARPPSPHGFNRICSNAALSAHVDETGAWPKGAAAVKELYASADGDKPVGYAVYLKVAADSKAGDNWYWYERVPLDHLATHDAAGVVADALGSAGADDPAKKICVGCHAAAGSDPTHTPSAHGRDEVYTPVQ